MLVASQRLPYRVCSVTRAYNRDERHLLLCQHNGRPYTINRHNLRPRSLCSASRLCSDRSHEFVSIIDHENQARLANDLELRELYAKISRIVRFERAPPRLRNWHTKTVQRRQIEHTLVGVQSATDEDALYERTAKQNLAETTPNEDVPAAQPWLKKWLSKLRVGWRHFGTRGVMAMWSAARAKQVKLPLAGPIADEIWATLIVAAQEGQFPLEEIVSYAEAEKKNSGKHWPHLYVTIITAQLEKGVDHAVTWHSRMQSNLPPNVQDYEIIFSKWLKRGLPLNTFSEFYSAIPFPEMYDFIISSLCKLKRYDEAFDWHFTLLAANDKPQDSTNLLSLLQHFRRIKDKYQLAMLVTGILEHGLMPTEELRSLFPVPRDKRHHKSAGRRGYTDIVCARLFATTLFSIGSVINGLNLLKVTSIGPHALREIVSRAACDGATICDYLGHLQLQRVRIQDCKYCFLVRQAAIKNQTWLLESMIGSDLDPDAYDDVNLQEKLYAGYLKQGDQIQADRTLAVMDIEVPRAKLQMQRLNFMLRANISLKRRRETFELIEKMKAANVPITPKSSRHLRTHSVKPREGQLTETPAETLRSTRLAIDVMKYTVETAGPNAFPIDAWREILWRLGTNGLLVEFQRLAIWLVNQYNMIPVLQDCDKAPQNTNGNTANQLDLPEAAKTSELNPVLQDNLALERAQHLSQYQTATPKPERIPPLPRLFSEDLQKEIVKWGFRSHVRKQRPYSESNDLGLRPTPQQPSWTWGPRLLQELRSNGVLVYSTNAIIESSKQLGLMFNSHSPFTRALRKLCRERSRRYFGNQKNIRQVLHRIPIAQRRRLIEAQARENIYERFVNQMYEVWGKAVPQHGFPRLRRVKKSNLSNNVLLRQGWVAPRSTIVVSRPKRSRKQSKAMITVKRYIRQRR